MAMAFLYWILVAVIGCFGGIWIYKKRSKKYSQAMGWVFALLFIGSPLYYEFPNARASKVATYENGKIIYHPYGTFCWEFSGGGCFNVPEYVCVISSGVNPLTSNPKLKSVRYKIAVRIVSPEIFYDDFQRRQLGTEGDYAQDLDTNVNWGHSNRLRNEVYHIISYWLFEFNNSHSREISEFYNPNDEEQKRRFRILIEGYVNPKIASEGLVVEFESFAIKYI